MYVRIDLIKTPSSQLVPKVEVGARWVQYPLGKVFILSDHAEVRNVLWSPPSVPGQAGDWKYRNLVSG